MGENLFMQNKPEEAVVYLEKAVAGDPAHVKAFLYLGMVYEQMNDADKAIEVYQQVLDRAEDLSANVANNLGNAYYKKDDIAEAERLYTQAIDADQMYVSAYLGRANARLKMGLLQDAVADYEQYLLLEPYASQQPAIANLIAYIKAESAGEEQQNLTEEVSAFEAESYE